MTCARRKPNFAPIGGGRVDYRIRIRSSPQALLTGIFARSASKPDLTSDVRSVTRFRDLWSNPSKGVAENKSILDYRNAMEANKAKRERGVRSKEWGQGVLSHPHSLLPTPRSLFASTPP